MPTAIPSDPWSSGFMAAGSVATAALNDKTNMTNGVNITNAFDSSNWSVNIGSGSQTTSAVKTTSQGDVASMLKNPLILVGLAVAAYYLLGRK